MLPVMVLAYSLPIPVKLPTPLKCRCSTLAARLVMATVLQTVSMPAPISSRTTSPLLLT